MMNQAAILLKKRRDRMMIPTVRNGAETTTNS